MERRVEGDERRTRSNDLAPNTIRSHSERTSNPSRFPRIGSPNAECLIKITDRLGLIRICVDSILQSPNEDELDKELLQYQKQCTDRDKRKV